MVSNVKKFIVNHEIVLQYSSNKCSRDDECMFVMKPHDKYLSNKYSSDDECIVVMKPNDKYSSNKRFREDECKMNKNRYNKVLF